MNTPTPVDPEKLKAATRDQWDRSAKGWNDHHAQIREWLREPTTVMLDIAGVRAGARVLDVAAGAGDQTLDIAERVGPTGSVLATDLSPGILELAKQNARRAGHGNVETKVADAEDLKVQEASFDAAICRLGLMFCPNPGKALSQMFTALKPGGRASVLVFSGPDKNPCITIVGSTALKHAGLPLRDPFDPGSPFSLGKPGLIDELFERAGFSDVATTKLAALIKLPSAKDYVDFMRTSAGAIVDMLSKLDGAGQDTAWAEMEDRLNAFGTSNGWVGPYELLLTAGRR